MNNPNASVEQRQSYVLTWPCAFGNGCQNTFSLGLTCTTSYANKRKSKPPPNAPAPNSSDARPWRDGFCPDHADEAGG